MTSPGGLDATEPHYGGYGAEVSVSDLERCFFLDDSDLERVRRCRGDHHRLGFALQLGTLRYLGTFLPNPIDVPTGAIDYLAEQLHIDDGSCIKKYMSRRNTHFEHAAEIAASYGYSNFADAEQELVRWIDDRSWTTGDGPKALLDGAHRWLLARRVLLHGLTRLERLVLQTRDQATQRLHQVLVDQVDARQVTQLESLLEVREGDRVSALDRLRRGPTVPSGKALVAALDRILEIVALGVSGVDVSVVPVRRVREIGRWGMTAKAPALRRHLAVRRTATLLATAVYLEAKAIDDALELFDLLMTNDLIAKARRQARSETLKRYPKVARDAAKCAAVINVVLGSADWDSDATVDTLLAAIDAVVPRADLVAAVENIAAATPPPSARAGGEWRTGIVDRYATVRRFLPSLCDTIEFGATAGAMPILNALLTLPELMLLRPTKRVPTGYLAVGKVDTEIVPAGWWHSLVFPDDRPEGTVDRAAYVFCVLEQFHQRLGRRDIFATASSRWADPRGHLLSGSAWTSAKGQVLNALGLPEKPDDLLTAHSELVHDTLAHASTAAIVDDQGRLHATAIEAIPDSPSLIDLLNKCEAMLPVVDIGEAILEVMSWEPEFVEAFTSASGAETRLADLDVTIAAALTAHALNVGFSPIISPGNPALSRNRLSHVDQNYLRGATYSAANAPIVAAQADIDLARMWGGGLVAAVDGIRFVVPVRSIHKRPNPKYFGRRRGATMLDLVNDHAVGIASMVVSGTPRDSLHVIDLIYRQDAGPRPEVIITDTGSYSDIVFGLLQLLGFHYRPQLADLPDQKLWRIDPDADYGPLNTAARGRINIDRIKRHWPDILRIIGSIHTGTVTAYEIIRMLSHRGQPTQLGMALADYGRIFKPCTSSPTSTTSPTDARSNSCGTSKRAATLWPDTLSTGGGANFTRPTRKGWKTNSVPSASPSTPSPSGTPCTSTQPSNNYAKTDTRSRTKMPCASPHTCEDTSTCTVTTASNKHHLRPADHSEKCPRRHKTRSLNGTFRADVPQPPERARPSAAPRR